MSAEAKFGSLQCVADDGKMLLSDGWSRTSVANSTGIRPGHLKGAPSDFYSMDPRYVVLRSNDYAGGLNIYDLETARVIARYDDSSEVGILFHAGDRFLLVPREGPAKIFADGQWREHFGDYGTLWRWGEDGSVWTMEGQSLKILHWRDATPTWDTLTVTGNVDDRVGEMQVAGIRTNASYTFWHYGPAWAAVWGDGQLLARTETLPAPGHHGDEMRQLSLYRGDTFLGSYQLPLYDNKRGIDAMKSMSGIGPTFHPRKDKDAYPTAYYQEHLAFTRDGKFLAWMVVNGQGRLMRTVDTGIHLLVFRVPTPIR